MKKRQFLTPIEDIALSLVFESMAERRINRTQQEYATIAANLPPLQKLVFKINTLLRLRHERSAVTDIPLPQICRFQPGDQRCTFEDYPRQISIETLRGSLESSGMRVPRNRRSNPF
jgi:hypothetical protein